MSQQPLGRWIRISEPHPESGMVAFSHDRFQHPDGYEITIWAEVEDDAYDYEVTEDDEFSVEIYTPNDDYIEGEAFETEAEAREFAQEQMGDLEHYSSE